MPVFKCKNCGKDIEYARGKGIVICRSLMASNTIEDYEKRSKPFAVFPAFGMQTT